MKFSARALPLLVALATMTLPAFVNAEPIKFARYPHVAVGRLVFSYHGDIWIANQDGTNPTRLTAHVARDSFPRFSPDGKLVAFSSNRMGNDDVFVMSAAGGEPRQLTVHRYGSYRLINGGTIRTPGSLVVTYDPTKPNNYGINLENYGVPPDVWVENTPEDELSGFDRELKTAVDEALRMLKEGRWQFTTEQQDK
jgi:tricorn protease